MARVYKAWNLCAVRAFQIRLQTGDLSMKSMILAAAAVATLGLGACTMTQNERAVLGGLGGTAGGLILADALNANANWTIVAALGGAAAGALVARNSASGKCAYANGDGRYYEAACA
jgi:hypothetical protein